MDTRGDLEPAVSAASATDLDFELTELEARLAPGLGAEVCSCGSGCGIPACSSCSGCFTPEI